LLPLFVELERLPDELLLEPEPLLLLLERPPPLALILPLPLLLLPVFLVGILKPPSIPAWPLNSWRSECFPMRGGPLGARG